ncbi:MAG TPA: response regulator [Thermoflexia bacterium]|jgi:PleD family two-component response regulator|nr:response regulator [Thermoflexia bacterium]
MSEGRILIVEDDFDISNMLRIYFQSQGYEVAVAPRGEDALEMCRQQLPNVVVLDIMLPDIDGYEVCRRLRSNLRTSHIPIIFLTQKDERSDKIHGLELGADDYITKPFDVEELKLRVRNAMARATYESLTNPTTGLPSAKLIEEQLRQLMRRDEWGIIYIGINGLDAFTEVYGFVAGDEVLRYTAMVIGESVDAIGTPNDFIGHVGGDDFLVITEKSLVEPLVKDLERRFSEGVGTHYDFKARQQGYIVVRDDEGNERKVGLMSLAIGVVTSDDGPFTDIREITEAAAAARREGRRP